MEARHNSVAEPGWSQLPISRNISKGNMTWSGVVGDNFETCGVSMLEASFESASNSETGFGLSPLRELGSFSATFSLST